MIESEEFDKLLKASVAGDADGVESLSSTLPGPPPADEGANRRRGFAFGVRRPVRSNEQQDVVE